MFHLSGINFFQPRNKWPAREWFSSINLIIIWKIVTMKISQLKPFLPFHVVEDSLWCFHKEATIRNHEENLGRYFLILLVHVQKALTIKNCKHPVKHISENCCWPMNSNQLSVTSSYSILVQRTRDIPWCSILCWYQICSPNSHFSFLLFFQPPDGAYRKWKTHWK